MISYSQNQALVINVNGKISLQSIICRRDKNTQVLLMKTNPQRGNGGPSFSKRKFANVNTRYMCRTQGVLGGLGL